VLKVCELTNLSESNCKESSRTLRREFKRVTVTTGMQLSAAKV
jgi:hypothetical protein